VAQLVPKTHPPPAPYRPTSATPQRPLRSLRDLLFKTNLSPFPPTRPTPRWRGLSPRRIPPPAPYRPASTPPQRPLRSLRGLLFKNLLSKLTCPQFQTLRDLLFKKRTCPHFPNSARPRWRGLSPRRIPPPAPYRPTSAANRSGPFVPFAAFCSKLTCPQFLFVPFAAFCSKTSSQN
jgi:hypothetical protein